MLRRMENTVRSFRVALLKFGIQEQAQSLDAVFQGEAKGYQGTLQNSYSYW